MTTSPLLEVVDLHASNGKSHILRGVSLRVDQGEIVSLLGRNGVGRSTTIKAIMGDVATKGSIRFRGDEIAGLKPHQAARRGLGYVGGDPRHLPRPDGEADTPCSAKSPATPAFPGR